MKENLKPFIKWLIRVLVFTLYTPFTVIIDILFYIILSACWAYYLIWQVYKGKRFMGWYSFVRDEGNYALDDTLTYSLYIEIFGFDIFG